MVSPRFRDLRTPYRAAPTMISSVFTTRCDILRRLVWLFKLPVVRVIITGDF